MLNPIQNPYVVGRIVTGEGRFFGRDDELNRLRTMLLLSERPQHVSVTGETRSGKSSLIMEFLRREDEALRNRYTILVLDVSADFERGSPRDFYGQLGEFVLDALEGDAEPVTEMVTQWRGGLSQPRRLPVQHRLKKLMQRVAAENRPVLLILDEFDGIGQIMGGDQDGLKILRNLGLYAETTYLVSSRLEICEIEQDAGISSNFAGIFDLSPIRLGPFNPRDARQLCVEPVSRLGRPWDDKVAEALLRYSGGHPYLLQGLCHRLVHESWGCTSAQQLEILNRVAPQTFDPMFSFLEKRLSRGKLLAPLRLALQGHADQVDREHLNRLERLGYIVKSDDGRFQPFSPLLVDALGVADAPEILPGTGAETVPPDEKLLSWGLVPKACNVLVEGDTDVELLTIAAQKYQSRTGENLLDGMHIQPAGPGRRGGAKQLANRLIIFRDQCRNNGTRVVALLDNDTYGRKMAASLDGLGLQRNKEFLMLDMADYPIRNYHEERQMEIEDLLSSELLGAFAKKYPDAVERIVDQKSDGIRYSWKGEFKDNLVSFVREHGQVEDLKRVVCLLRKLRTIFLKSQLGRLPIDN